MQKLSLSVAGIVVLSLAAGCAGSKKAAKPQGQAADEPSKKVNKSVASTCSDQGKTADAREADVDGDGRPDLFKYYKEVDDPARPGERKTILARQDVDLNWDGTLDICRFFTVSGKVEREEYDLDYDGKIDEVRTYEDGVIAIAERDRNNDGRMDIIRKYKDGKLVQKQTDTNDDGQVDRWEYYDGDTLDRIGVDFDHDGKVDRWAKSAR